MTSMIWWQTATTITPSVHTPGICIFHPKRVIHKRCNISLWNHQFHERGHKIAINLTSNNSHPPRPPTHGNKRSRVLLKLQPVNSTGWIQSTKDARCFHYQCNLIQVFNLRIWPGSPPPQSSVQKEPFPIQSIHALTGWWIGIHRQMGHFRSHSQAGNSDKWIGCRGGLQDMLGLTENDGGGLDREHLNPVITKPLQWAGAVALFTPAMVRI